MTQSQAPPISDESLAEARRLVGIWLNHHQRALVVTRDLIRQWAHSMGDENSLFCNEDYAKGTRWGEVIAPVGFLMHAHSTHIGPGLRGIQWIYGGTEWQLFRPVRAGDIITARPRLLDAVEKKGEHVPRFVIQIGEVTFRNQRDEIVARAISTMNRVPRVPSGGQKGYAPRLEQYSLEQLEELARVRRAEVRRGAVPRYWEDVNVGDELPPIVKGPLRAVEVVIAASAGENEVNNFQGAHIYQIMHRRRHPADSYLDPETGVADHPHRGHWETYMSQAVGMPGQYDLGRQRILWLAQMVTDWMGDDGFIRYHKVSIRRPNVVNDITWCKGKVTEKRVEEGRHLVALDVWAENQRGEVTAPGKTIVELISRNGAGQ